MVVMTSGAGGAETATAAPAVGTGVSVGGVRTMTGLAAGAVGSASGTTVSAGAGLGSVVIDIGVTVKSEAMVPVAISAVSESGSSGGVAVAPDVAGVVSSSAAVVSAGGSGDRKSTRLNSSHVEISYAVFSLKKKNKQ